jgi:hypothetical protein
VDRVAVAAVGVLALALGGVVAAGAGFLAYASDPSVVVQQQLRESGPGGAIINFRVHSEVRLADSATIAYSFQTSRGTRCAGSSRFRYWPLPFVVRDGTSSYACQMAAGITTP